MSWQDFVILVGQLTLFVTLFPTIVSRARVPLLTSVPAFVVLSGFALTFATIGLLGSAATSVMNAAAWLAIAVNRIKAVRS